MVEVVGHDLLVAVTAERKGGGESGVKECEPEEVVGSPSQAGLRAALLQSGFGFDVLRVVLAVLIRHHAAGARVQALGRGQLVAFKGKPRTHRTRFTSGRGARVFTRGASTRFDSLRQEAWPTALTRKYVAAAPHC